MHAFKRFLAASLLILIVALSFFLLWISSNHVTPIIMYHHVDVGYEDQANWVTPQRFDEHMKFLKKNDYEVISLDQLVTSIIEERPLSRRSIVITVDDGHADNYKHLYPILKQYGFTATIFISSDLIGQEGFLTWEQVQEMSDNGIDFGSHTRTHTYLPDLHQEDMRDEIINSKGLIGKKLGKPIHYFSYPVGGFNYEIQSVVKEAAYKGAVTTNRGYDRMNEDVYELNRIRLSNSDDNPLDLWAKFSGYYNLFRSLKSPE